MNDLVKMSTLSPGERATVCEISRSSDLRRRFFDVGLINNSEIECVCVSPMGDPKAYMIKGAIIAIRARDACRVLVRRI